MMVPMVIKGVRLPKRVRHLSESAPKRGSIKTARMLSSAMITPDQVWDIPNLLVKITGMVASYACQKALIRKKAKPTRMVRL